MPNKKGDSGAWAAISAIVVALIGLAGGIYKVNHSSDGKPPGEKQPPEITRPSGPDTGHPTGQPPPPPRARTVLISKATFGDHRDGGRTSCDPDSIVMKALEHCNRHTDCQSFTVDWDLCEHKNFSGKRMNLHVDWDCVREGDKDDIPEGRTLDKWEGETATISCK
jgi:hypothetical protein